MLTHPIKQMKHTHLPQELEGKPISPKKTLYHQQKALLDLNPENLSIQRIKRMNATMLAFSDLRSRDPVEIPKPLIKAIGFPKNIQELSLSLEYSFVDQDLRRLAQSLKRLKSLKRLTLDFDVSNITDEGFGVFMKGLRRLCYLKGIKLEIPDWEKITDAGLNFASQSLKRIRLLEGIELHFENLSPLITAEGVLKLNGSLNHLKHLKNITFKAPYWKEITDKALMNMKWRRLVDLQTVYLEFHAWDQLTHIGLDLITRNLKGFANLQSVHLNLFECPEFDNLSLRCIWEMMNSLPSFTF